MGLIDGDETDTHVAQFLLKEFGSQTLRGDIKQLHVTEDAVLKGNDDFLVCQTGIDGCRLDALAEQMVDLVLHEGDERRDDDTDAVHGEGWHLERDGLATARRHQSKCVVTGTYRLDNLTLNAPEIIIAPVSLQDFPVASHPPLLLRRFDVLDLQLNLAALVDIVLNGIDDIKRTLRLDEFD